MIFPFHIFEIENRLIFLLKYFCTVSIITSYINETDKRWSWQSCFDLLVQWFFCFITMSFEYTGGFYNYSILKITQRTTNYLFYKLLLWRVYNVWDSVLYKQHFAYIQILIRYFFTIACRIFENLPCYLSSNNDFFMIF